MSGNTHVVTQVTSHKVCIPSNTTVRTLNFACELVNSKQPPSVLRCFVLLVLFAVILFFIAGVTPMVQDAKAVAINTQDTVAVSRWRDSNRAVSFRYILNTFRISFVHSNWRNYDAHHMWHWHAFLCRMSCHFTKLILMFQGNTLYNQLPAESDFPSCSVLHIKIWTHVQIITLTYFHLHKVYFRTVIIFIIQFVLHVM